ncbi:MAG: large conductance mechanosensitive channel protein MscL [Chthoniobacteraceae bacterium]
MLDGFKKFILRGNVVDLAVGVIIGAAFGAVVTSLTTDVITPLIGLIVGKPDFSGIHAGPVLIGKFINAIVSFFLQATAVYFGIVIPLNKLMAMMAKKQEPPPPAPPTPEQVLLAEIRDLLKAK